MVCKISTHLWGVINVYLLDLAFLSAEDLDFPIGEAHESCNGGPLM